MRFVRKSRCGNIFFTYAQCWKWPGTSKDIYICFEIGRCSLFYFSLLARWMSTKWSSDLFQCFTFFLSKMIKNTHFQKTDCMYMWTHKGIGFEPAAVRLKSVADRLIIAVICSDLIQNPKKKVITNKSPRFFRVYFTFSKQNMIKTQTWKFVRKSLNWRIG